MKYILFILLAISFGAKAQQHPFKPYAFDFRHYHYLWADTLKQTYNLAYNATTWNGNLGIPTMDAVRDKIESLSGGGISSINSQTGSSQTIAAGTGLSVNSSSNTHTITADQYNIDKQYADANNSGTSETDLYSKTVATNQLSTDGSSLHFEASGTLNDGTATTSLQLYFGGNSIGGVSGLSVSGAGNWTVKGVIIRSSSSTCRGYSVITIDNATAKVFTTTFTIGSMNFATTNILKITGQAGGAGGGSNDITGQTWNVDFHK